MFKSKFLDKDINIESPIVSKINSISKNVLILGAFIHFVYLVIFSIMGIKELVIFNIFSVICYLILQSKPFNRTVSILFFVIHLEVTLHASVAIILLGWDYGFSYIILCVITLMYISPFKNKKMPYIYGGTEMIIFMLLKLYCLMYEPVYQNVIPTLYVNLVLFYNLSMCFVIMISLSKMNNSTNDLAQYMLTETNKDLQQTASHDPLTNLLNRRSMEAKLNEAIAEKNTSNKPFCIVMCDIDDFRFFNNTYGHLCGDFVLKTLANEMIACTRIGDYICRWGGEEFLFLLNNASIEAAKIVIERLQNSIKNAKWIYEGHEIKVTMTFGISSCNRGMTLEALIEEADNRLYEGKHNGKNCIIAG